ncbi:MAG: alpha-ketoacid dehydrogenase subunit beta [Propionibacteriaceae bacterium]|nr:alpha-ketoacid dehydrogenase subunit beta [Propionibacteriaceae bacterium]
MTETRYIKAIAQALDEEMARDDNVFIVGEDVAASGGAFGATRGLLDKYGKMRVLDTPISEAAITGLALGASVQGLRPVLEIMFSDFLMMVMDQIVNQIAKTRYMFGGQFSAPLVIRAPGGGGLNAGPQHSQNLEAWFAHVPGLRVVVPSNPYDAKGLLKAAIRSDDPVLFLENKALYAMKGDVPDEEYLLPLDKAVLKREGRDVTIVALSRMVNEALAAADSLAETGIDAEVIDLCSVSPIDTATIFASVEKTSRLVIAHEAVKTAGIGAEVSALVAEEMIDCLDGPIVRVGAPFAPVPFGLEQEYLPDRADIVEAAAKLMAY